MATQIKRSQIKDGAIDNSKIDAAANIALSKINGGTGLIKADGTVAMTGALAMGNQKVTGLGTPTASTDATTKSYVDNLIAGLNSLFKYKPSVRAASTSNVNITNPGTANFDGVTLTNGQRILLKNQTTTNQNGIYVFNGSGSAMTRATDFDSWDEIPGALVVVEEGTTQADTMWLATSDQGGTLGTTAIVFTNVQTTAGLSTTNFVWGETPSGTMNGVNTTFTLANTPTGGSVQLYLNGVRLRLGAGKDFTVSGSTITMLEIPDASDTLEADYLK